LSPLGFTLLVLGISYLAGLLGSLVGVGGGIIVVPALTLLLGVSIQKAIAASIISVIATSSGAAASYVRERIANMRLGMLLEVATVIGALTGAFLADYISGRGLFLTFAVVLFYTVYSMVKPKGKQAAAPVPDPMADRLRLHGSFFDRSLGREVAYRISRSKLGLGVSYFAGVASGLLGIGGGVLKVPVMNVAMGMPIKACTATSNFMIGVTAAASAGVYLTRGYIQPGLAMPVTLGVLVGSLIGARVLAVAQVKTIRRAFVVVIAALGIEMIFNGATGRL